MGEEEGARERGERQRQEKKCLALLAHWCTELSGGELFTQRLIYEKSLFSQI